MFRKMLLTTSALVVASSMALAAAQNGRLSPSQQLERAKFVTRHALEQHMPGVIFDRKHGIPVAIRPPASGRKRGAQGRGSTGARARNDSNNFSRGKNAQFLSYFGWFAGRTNARFSSSFSYCISYNSNYTQCFNHEHVHLSSQIALTNSFAAAFTHVSDASSIVLSVGSYSGTGPYKAAIYKDASGLPGAKVAGAGGKFSAPTCTYYCNMTNVHFPPVSLKKKRQYWVVVSGTKKDDGRLVWFAQEIQYQPVQAYNINEHVKYRDTYETTRSGHQSTYSASYSTGTGGWIHTSGFTFEEAIFSVTGKAGP